jgi:uncharacterized protein YjbJ (UPF0337 family)
MTERAEASDDRPETRRLGPTDDDPTNPTTGRPGRAFMRVARRTGGPAGSARRRPPTRRRQENEMDENRIAGAAREFGGKVQGAAGTVAGNDETRAEGKRDEVGGATETRVGQASDTVRDVAGEAGDLADRAIDTGRDVLPEAGAAPRRGGDTLTQYAKEFPLAFAAMAGALGYLLAVAIRRRR